VELIHRFVTSNGIRMHVAEQGEGHPVIFCHGFPHTWFMWHRQLAAVAAAGYRAVAPDLRGYGRTDVPTDIEDYSNRAVIGDLLGLLDEMGAEQAVFVGLDFGAALVWELALRAPERVSGVIVLNNPFAPRPPRAPSQLWAKAAQRHFLHLDYFQKPGVADAELGGRTREFLARVYYSLSADYHYLDTWRFPAEGTGYLDVLPEAPLLPWRWLSIAEFDTLAQDFSTPASPAVSTGTACSIGTGNSPPNSPTPRSPFRRISSTATETRIWRASAGATRSQLCERTFPICAPSPRSRTRVTSCSWNAPTRSTL